MSSNATTAKAPFQQGMRALVGGVTIVAAHDAGGAPHGLTATAVTSLSADPPSLLICVNRTSGLAATLVAGTHFSVNVLSAGQIDVAQAFGGQRGIRGSNRFIYGDWFRSEAGCPVLNGAKVAFECSVADVHDYATHHIVIGSVVDVLFIRHDTKALAYVDGAYHAVG